MVNKLMDTVTKTAENVGMDAEKTGSKRVVKVGLSPCNNFFLLFASMRALQK